MTLMKRYPQDTNLIRVCEGEEAYVPSMLVDCHSFDEMQGSEYVRCCITRYHR